MTKKKSYCPVCYGAFEVIDVAPCDECGSLEEEIRHFLNGEHSYAEFAVYGTELVLCDFCDVDFSSYHPEFWGFARGKTLGYGSDGFRKLRELPREQLSIAKGKYCPTCKARSTFLEALVEVRNNSQEKK
jgi:hypothetical protein